MVYSTAMSNKGTQVNLDDERIQELEQRLAKLELAAEANTQACNTNTVTFLASFAYQTGLTTVLAAKQVYSCTKATANAVVNCGKYLMPMVFSREAVKLLVLGATTVGVINRLDENQTDILKLMIDTGCFHKHANTDACHKAIGLYADTVYGKENADVQYSIGEMYYKTCTTWYEGESSCQAKTRAGMLEWYKKAAAQKHKDALYRLINSSFCSAIHIGTF